MPDASLPGAQLPAAWEARCLLRLARDAVLATQSGGQPYAALVTPAVLPDASVLLLLSGLSEHTRHLRSDPRCALFVAGEPSDRNPQTAPRLNLMARAVPEHDPALRACWLAVHPYAAFYASLPDFTLWRLTIVSGHFIGGFARAFRLSVDEILPDPTSLVAVQRAEASVIAHCNDDHADALGVIAGQAGRGWRMVSVDTDGFSMVFEDIVKRVAWSRPVSDAMDIRGELVRLTQAARANMRPEPE